MWRRFTTFLQNVCSILHFKSVYLCIYDLFHILLSLWHPNGSMEYISVCVCACLQIPYVIVFYQLTLLDACSFYIQIYTMWTQIDYIKNSYIIICLSASITENCISSKSTSFFTVSSRSLIKHWSKNHIYRYFSVIHTMHVLTFNTSFNICTLWFTIYDIYQLLHILALRCHPQEVIYNKAI